MDLAAFAGRDAADHLGAVGDGLLGVEGALSAGDALADDLGVLVDRGWTWLRRRPSRPSTIFSAPSDRSLAAMTFRPLEFEDFLAELDVGAFQAHHQGHLQADLLHRGDHALGDDVAAHDAAEDVDQDALHVGVGGDDLEGRGRPSPWWRRRRTSRKLAGSAP